VDEKEVSVPFTSGSSLQRDAINLDGGGSVFQFPLHRDPRCNSFVERGKVDAGSRCFSSLYIGILAATSGTWDSIKTTARFQFPLHRDPRCNWKYLPTKTQKKESFSSLYIGILAATSPCRWPSRMIAVSVPFTSGSSLQRLMPVVGSAFAALTVSVPFTSGSSLQLAG